ncbi:heat shock protein HtpX [Halorientalis persicus]|uniref:Heat shock protein HtpX n=1 Tax=Halorientalis persicus TaxID=1367881 RepID=A0A1H8TE59_9EURY|nr:M48 family metalloprotease [Halorientalis persicus]SEO89115.1 heat shock protein HtpX [Halorientalis persicus]
MGRLGLRALMAGVGLSLLAGYGLAAWAVYSVLVWVWASRPPLGTTVAIVAATTLVLGYLSYQYGTSQLLASVDAADLPRERAPELYRRADRLAAEMRIETPRLLVADMAVPNALALGSPADGTVVLDRALFRLLSTAELEGILAHEFAHLESRDSLIQTLAYSGLRTLVGIVTVLLSPALLFLTGLARGVAWIRGRPTRWAEGTIGQFRLLIGNGVVVLLFVFTLAIRAHSRRRELAADDRAVSVTGDPMALARALAKIDRVRDPNWSLLSPLYTRGDEDGTLGQVLSTHPAIDERIERLRERARASDPRQGL